MNTEPDLQISEFVYLPTLRLQAELGGHENVRSLNFHMRQLLPNLLSRLDGSEDITLLDVRLTIQSAIARQLVAGNYMSIVDFRHPKNGALFEKVHVDYYVVGDSLHIIADFDDALSQETVKRLTLKSVSDQLNNIVQSLS